VKKELQCREGDHQEKDKREGEEMKGRNIEKLEGNHAF